MTDVVRSDRLTAAPIQTASEQVVTQLRTSILSGALPVGHRLPTEGELAATFQVGRSTVREAVRVLVSQRLVVIRRGAQGGTFVVGAEPGWVSESLETGIGMLSVADQVSLGDLLQARRAMEVPAIGIAARNRTEADLESISAAMALEEVQPGAVSGGARRVHSTFLAATHNPLLEMVIRPVFGVIRTRYFNNRRESDLWEQINREHAEIFLSVREQQVGKAQDLMHAHMDTLDHLYEEIEERAADFT